MMEVKMEQYVGLDVSQLETHVCVLDKNGDICWQGKTLSNPEDLAHCIRKHAPNAVKVGLETGPLSTWHWHGLNDLGIPIICLCARHAKAALKMQINKTDKNDARGLAEIMRTGWYRSVQVKTMQSHALLSKLGVRAKLINIRRDIATQIRGIMKTFGLVVGSARRQIFERRVLELLEGDNEIASIVEPLLSAWRHIGDQIVKVDKVLLGIAKASEDCRRLMTMPGVGIMTALTFIGNIDEADRFARSRSIGAYFGLTPRRYQSGEIDVSGRISKCGSSMMRSYLFEAALTLLTRVKKWSALKAWAMQVAKRKGMKKATVALARKMAVTMFAMLRDKSDYRWSTGEEATA
jgi:transposase